MSYPQGFSTGYPYPAYSTIDPQYLFGLRITIQQNLKHAKEVAEEHLKKKNYKQALEIYNKQLEEVKKSLVWFPDHLNDIPPLLTNRSLVYIKLNDLSLALKDADECLQNFPLWRKGYLRKYQALICISDIRAKYDALRSLLNGLVWAFGSGNYDEKDHVTFLTEVAKTIPSLQDDPENLLGQIIPPTKNSNFVVKMLEEMVACKHWEGVNVIVIAAHKGPSSCLDGIGDKLGKNVPVGTILKLPGNVLKGWELKLCATLIRNGSPVKNIETVHDQPPVHFGVSIALETEYTDLLKSIIDVIGEEDINARNSKNESALHLVLKSKKVTTQLGETLLRLLLNHGCQIDLLDAKNCLKSSDPNYHLLVEAEKKMVEITRKKINQKKEEGNLMYTSEKNYDKALQFYTEGLSLCQNNAEFAQEEARLLTNRSKVFSALNREDAALADAELAIKKDPLWNKGYWRKGQVQRSKGLYMDSLNTFLIGCENCTSTDEDLRIDFLAEALVSLHSITCDKKLGTELYNQFLSVKSQEWTKIMVKLAKTGQWPTICDITLGPVYIVKDLVRTGALWKYPDVGQGLAKDVSTSGVDYSTMFVFLQKNKTDKEVLAWLICVIKIMIKNSNGLPNTTFFRQNAKDQPLHAAVAFSLITETTFLLESLTKENITKMKKLDGDGKPPFHLLISSTYGRKSAFILKVAEILLKKGLSPHLKDKQGKTILDYIMNLPDKRALKDLILTNLDQRNPSNVKENKCDANALLQKGNDEFRREHYQEAVKYYSDALQNKTALSREEKTCLHERRFYASFKISQFNKCQEDIEGYIECRPYHFKGVLMKSVLHLLSGDIQGVLFLLLEAASMVKDHEKSKFLKEIFLFCLTNFLFHLKEEIVLVEADFFSTAYELILDGKLNEAKHAFELSSQFAPPFFLIKEKVMLDLKPLCNMELLKRNFWMGVFLFTLLDYGCDYKTLSLTDGDVSLHALIKIVLALNLQIGVDVLRKLWNEKIVPAKEHCFIDKRGNSLLHVVCKDRHCNPVSRHLLLNMILGSPDINTLCQNVDGKMAKDYIPMNERENVMLLSEHMMIQKEYQKKVTVGQKQTEKFGKQEVTKKPLTGKKQDAKSEDAYGKPVGGEPKGRPNKNGRDVCYKCEEFLEEGKHLLEKEQKMDAYVRLAKLLREKHQTETFRKQKEKALNLITNSIANTLNPEIPYQLVKIPTNLFKNIVQNLLDREKWVQADVMIRVYRKHHGTNSFINFAESIDIVKVISSCSLRNQEYQMNQIMDNMLNSGAQVTKNDKQYIEAVIQNEQFILLCPLVKKGADPKYVSLKKGDTPVHAALFIGLNYRDDFSLLDLFIGMWESDSERYKYLDPNQQDSTGDGLFHVVAKEKYNSKLKKAITLLIDRKVNISLVNNDDKRPFDYLTKQDRRIQFFKQARSEPTDVKPKKKPEVSKIHTKVDVTNETVNAPKSGDTGEKQAVKYEQSKPTSGQTKKQKLAPVTTTSNEVLKKKLEECIFGLPFYPYNVFNPKPPKGQEVKAQKEKSIEERDDAEQEGNLSEVTEVESDNQEEINLKENEEVDVQAFDNLEWEVECTANVWKTLRNKQTMPDQLKQRVIRKIQLLASGEWTKSLCKPIENVPDTLKIFEAKLSKGGRILWEVAVAFSPRLSESAERRLLVTEDSCDQMAVKGGRMYSEIIRVWDIVLDHPKINQCVQNIIKSYQRGEQCIIQKKLKGIKQTQFEATDAKRVPMIFAESDTNLSKRELQAFQDDLKQFYPPASSNEEEYHILKFYSFSSNLVQYVLQKMDIKVDFPFRVTDLEHAIIHLNTDAPILLLGRSGTGKTTCCLYRLWANFLSYWQNANEAQAPLLPRSVNFVQDDASEEEEESSEEESSDNIELTEEEKRDIEEKLLKEKEKQAAEEAAAASEVAQYDHLHQVFITKNIVLCSEVKKNFHELSHACTATDQHIAIEDKELPPCLQDIDEYQYPLFVTSKQLLLRLDASLDPPYFFDRNMDKSLKVEVEGWNDGEVLQQILPLLEESSSDEEEKDEKDKQEPNEGQKANVAKRKVKQDPRKEVTYQVFCDDVWTKIAKEYQKRFHPSLIWTEIMSFIRGSYEALLEPQGYLSESMYFDLGKKRAPNFTLERSHIYKIFKRYDHFKKQHQLFDETDLVRNIFYRLRKLETLPWVFHQIYVDETQDFTQAELCLLLRICSNPNDMFLTGDTAQSIMKGISFRFSDLKSLFFHSHKSLHAMGHTHSITVPKTVYQLTHNYRSHAGILSLASSILDIMVRFFPESFDRLEKDQGMFQGPCPVLLECNNFTDLAFMLQNLKRVTSHIEFGAHQAILVVDETAREKMPQELKTALVLTIFESKGLEFDDILLYNFFKDSQASKEWRVVTQFLEELRESGSDSCHDRTENLVEIDTSVFEENSRPRPLNFDPNQHKVLNAELKHLYTAVTRARVNVWIFDEDPEKRAPMFEYFKARKLVKILTTDQVEKEKGRNEDMKDKGFSCAEWVKRGDDFMRNNLFDLAAKCFERAGHETKHKTALAFGRALAALKSRDKQQKRAEFLKAAELFVECQEFSQAIKCLLNVQEKELAANLYEKMGQWEKAAEVYIRLKKPIEACRCWEDAGKIRNAIVIFVENKMYEHAIDVVTRYNRTLEELNMSGKDIPLVLRTHAPDKQGEYSLENLNYLAAEVHCEKRNKIKMLECLKKVARENRLNFLKRRNFFKEAGDILLEEGKHKEAVELFLENGAVDKAVAFGRQSENKQIICECLLVQSHLNIQKIKVAAPGEVDEMKFLKMSTIKDLDEVIAKAFSLYDNNLMGQAYYMKGLLTGNVADVNLSWGKYNKSQPRNGAGQLDCMDWMVYNSDLMRDRNCYQVILGMRNLFGVLETLTSKETEEKKIYLSHYGFIPAQDGTGKFKICKNLKPAVLELLDLEKQEGHNLLLKTEKEAQDIVCYHLLTKGRKWLERIQQVLTDRRQRYVVCPASQTNQCEKDNCENVHKFEKAFDVRENYKKLMIEDLRQIHLEYILTRGISVVQKNDQSQRIKDMLERFMIKTTDDPLWRFTSCKQLISDLMPLNYYPSALMEKPEYFLEIVKLWMTRDYKEIVPDHLVNYLTEWQNCFEEKNANIMNNAKFFFVRFFSEFFFKLNVKDTKRLMVEFESKLEVLYRKESPGNFVGIKTERFGDKTNVMCITHRFFDAVNELAWHQNPLEGLVKFTKFVILWKPYKTLKALPEMNHFLFWLEYFTTVGVCLIAKKSNNTFFLPMSYISIVYFVDQMNLDQGRFRTFPCIQRSLNIFFNQDGTPEARMDKMIEIMFCDHISLISQVFDEDKIKNALVTERVMVLCLTFLCNMGVTLRSTYEKQLFEKICSLEETIKNFPRFKNALGNIRESKSPVDLGNVLKRILWERGKEQLLFCMWDKSYSYGIKYEPIRKVSGILRERFNDPNTGTTETQAEKTVLQDEEEEGMSDEEKQQHMMERKSLMEEEAKQKSALIITKFMKMTGFRKKILMIGDLVKAQIKKERNECYFKNVETSFNRCAICGVTFDEEAPNAEANKPKRNRFQELLHNVGVSGDATDQRTISKQHYNSADHYERRKQFMAFKNVFINDIADVKELAQKMIQKHRFGEENTDSMFETVKMDIDKILETNKELGKKFESILREQKWNSYDDLKNTKNQLARALDKLLIVIKKNKEKNQAAKEKVEVEEKTQYEEAEDIHETAEWNVKQKKTKKKKKRKN